MHILPRTSTCTATLCPDTTALPVCVMQIGVHPGPFDPITLGHMDIIRRGAKLVDRLVIGVTTNIAKSPLFDDDERIAMVRNEVGAIDGDIRVVGFNSLLMDFAEREGASVIVRGLRAVADFRSEEHTSERQSLMRSSYSVL